MTIDSNIVIDFLNGDNTVAETLRNWFTSRLTLYLPTVAETEILSLSRLTAIERRKIEALIEENFTSIPFNRTLARIAADIRRMTKIKLPDAAIAATALYTHTPVVTRNVKDFRRVLNLEVIDIK